MFIRDVFYIQFGAELVTICILVHMVTCIQYTLAHCTSFIKRNAKLDIKTLLSIETNCTQKLLPSSMLQHDFKEKHESQKVKRRQFSSSVQISGQKPCGLRAT